MSSEITIELQQIGKAYSIYQRPIDRLKQMLTRRHYFQVFHALSNVSFTIHKGETVGIVGRNGSGKSTLLQIICGTLEPSQGECRINGRIAALLELGAGFNPEFTGRENIFLSSAIMGLSREETEAKLEEIIHFSGLAAHIDQPVKNYSSGMFVRLAFATAIASIPDILVVDEALAVGDELFQRKCFAKIRELQKQGCTILFVSHSANMVVELCDRALLLEGGELLLDGTPKTVLTNYHRLLFAAPERVEEIKQHLRSEQLVTETITRPEIDPITTETFLEFDPSLIPESRVIYTSRGAQIEGPALSTNGGEKVNMLKRRQEYLFSYKVTFKEDAFGVKCGMMIKTKSGLELAGIGTADETRTIPFLAKGTTLLVTYSFNCNLLPGTFFINCGCSGIIEGERVFLHRIIDAVMFRVMPEPYLREGGIVDCYLHPTIEVLS